MTDSLSVKIYVNQIENRTTFKIKTGYYLKLLMLETMKLFGNTNITKQEDGENVRHLEITEVELVHCNIAKNQYQHDSRVLYKFVPSRSFCQLLHASRKNFVFRKTFMFGQTDRRSLIM